jgi:hypothetical protein
MKGSGFRIGAAGRGAQDSSGAVHLLCVAGFALLAAGLFSISLWDSDYWWHIAAGREIWQSGRVPDQDPFSVFAPAEELRTRTVLMSQWLGQVLLYLAHRAGGVDGAVALRCAILTLTLLLVYARARVMGARGGGLWLLLAMTALLLLQNTGDRPNLFTIFSVTLLFLAVDMARRHPGATARRVTWLCSLPVIGWIWANLHGGFILGGALLALLCALSLIRSLFIKAERFDRGLGLATLAYLGLTLLTPNNVGTYLTLLQHETGTMVDRTSEYVSSLRIYSLGYVLPQIWVGAFYLIALGGAFTRWLRAAPEQWVVVLALALIAATAYRYMILFACVSAPYLAAALTPFGQRLAARLPAGLSRHGEALLLGVLVAVGLWQGARGALFQGGVVAQRFPEAAVAILKEHQASGRAFSTLEWGGYLLWHLSPAVTPFVDGRMLESARLIPYTHMLWVTPDGLRYFTAADFDLVVMPERGRFNRDPYTLPKWLDRAPNWQPIHRDPVALVFRRSR